MTDLWSSGFLKLWVSAWWSVVPVLPWHLCLTCPFIWMALNWSPPYAIGGCSRLPEAPGKWHRFTSGFLKATSCEAHTGEEEVARWVMVGRSLKTPALESSPILWKTLAPSHLVFLMSSSWEGEEVCLGAQDKIFWATARESKISCALIFFFLRSVVLKCVSTGTNFLEWLSVWYPPEVVISGSAIIVTPNPSAFLSMQQ